MFGAYGFGIPQALPKNLPAAPRARDKILYTTPRAESQWGSALGIALTKLASWSWAVESSTTARKNRLQQLLLMADYGHPSGAWGIVPFLERLGRDFLVTNNGCFFYIGRETQSYGSRINKLMHLSSIRCRRTGDPDYPVIYTARNGTETVLRWFEVVTLVDCPEPDDVGFGYGFCAADRAYDQIKQLAALESYLYEKLTANSPTMLHIINGINQTQLDDSLNDAKDDQDEAGAQQYMGAVILTMLKPDQTPAVASIQLAGLPDNATPSEVRERADVVYANALGMDLNEIRPTGGSQLGVGAASQVQHQKAKTKGVVSFMRQLEHAVNWDVFDPRSRFFYTERDLVDDERRARIASTYASAAGNLVKNGSMSPRQAQEWLIDNNLIPRRFAGRDIEGDSVSVEDKPDLTQAQDNITGAGKNQPVETFVDPIKQYEKPEPAGTNAPGPGQQLGSTTPETPKPELLDRTSGSRNEQEQPQQRQKSSWRLEPWK